MRTASAVLLLLIFLGAFAYGVASFVSENPNGREIKMLFCLLIATVCISALFIGTGQDEARLSGWRPITSGSVSVD